MQEPDYTTDDTIEELESIKKSMMDDARTYSKRINAIIKSLRKSKDEKNNKKN